MTKSLSLVFINLFVKLQLTEAVCETEMQEGISQKKPQTTINMKNDYHLLVLNRSPGSTPTETFNETACKYIKDTKLQPLRKITLKLYVKAEKIKVTNL